MKSPHSIVFLLLVCIAGWMSLPVYGARYSVTTAKQLTQNLPAALPGDTFVLADGDYALSWLKLTSLAGTEAQPIVVQAEHTLKARVVGTGCITLIDAAYLEFQGLDFDMAATSSMFKLQGAHHIRITHNRFTMSVDKEGQTSKWILIGDIWENDTSASGYNRIDYNLFEDKHDGGALIVIDGAHGTPGGISRHDRIDHNIFRRNTPRQDNEKETVRIGVSDLCMMSSYTVVENNLFEDCDGDPEVVSVKSCDNIVRNNTFRRCLGTLCLRHGYRNRAEGNIFLGEGKKELYDTDSIGCGGIRVYGKDHVIADNYMEGLTGNKWDPALALTNGDATNSGSASSKHGQPENVVISGNTFAYCASTLEIGFTNNGKYSKKPLSCRFEDNLILADEQPVTMHTNMGTTNILFADNSLYLYPGVPAGISYTASQFILLPDLPDLPSVDDRIMTEFNAGPYAADEDIPSALESATVQSDRCVQLRNGQIYIIRDGVRYTILGIRL